jgi:sulfatase maturation enzyme AslB (radical SAM superfamily)
MWGMKNYYLGHISDADPLKLKRLFVEAPCTQCDVANVCGGRCLYANITKRWSEEAYAAVCNTVRELVCAVKAEVPRIRCLVEKGTVNLHDFEFMKYNGCEIIP